MSFDWFINFPSLNWLKNRLVILVIFLLHSLFIDGKSFSSIDFLSPVLLVLLLLLNHQLFLWSQILQSSSPPALSGELRNVYIIPASI